MGIASLLLPDDHEIVKRNQKARMAMFNAKKASVPRVDGFGDLRWTQDHTQQYAEAGLAWVDPKHHHGRVGTCAFPG